MVNLISHYVAEGLDPYVNLAVEKHFLDTVREGEIILYLWQNERTVVIGRNQNIWKEVDVRSLLDAGGFPTRRLSGGGAVYHDSGNLNFTFISKRSVHDVPRQTGIILDAVRGLGFDAVKNGRNDLCIGSRKFSGHSYYLEGDACFHNGTVLVSENKDDMSRFLSACTMKLQSKGVDSVRSRTVNLSEIRPVGLDEVRSAILKSFEYEYGMESRPLSMTPGEIAYEERRFRDEDWIYNKAATFGEVLEVRLSDGNYELHLDVKRGVITDCAVYTDSLDPQAAESLRRRLVGNNRKLVLSL